MITPEQEAQWNINAELRKIQKIKKLMKDILYWKKRYYTDGRTPVSDGTYDTYESILGDLDPTNPVVAMVGYNEKYEIPRGYVPDPRVKYDACGTQAFVDGVEVPLNSVGILHKVKK